MKSFQCHIDSIKTLSSNLRQSVMALIADIPNKEDILNSVTEIIVEESKTIYAIYGTPLEGLTETGRAEYLRIVRASAVSQAAIQVALGILGPRSLLDDNRFIKSIDHSDMFGRLERWPVQIRTMRSRADVAAVEFKRNHPQTKIAKVKIFGLGGSAAPHEIAAEIISNLRKTRIEIEVVHADTPNPDYVDQDTLAIFASFSGNTEETLQCLEIIRERTGLRLALTKGGKLGEIAAGSEIPVIRLPDAKSDAYVVEPRESVCLQMTAVLVFLAGLGLDPGSNGQFSVEDLEFEKEIIPGIVEWRSQVGPHQPFIDNPAKQLALFLLYGRKTQNTGNVTKLLWDKRIPFVLADRNNRAIGHEVRTQIHERAKLNAAYYEAPEFLHNLVESMRAGVESSQAGLDADRFVYYFLRSSDEEPRMTLRLDKTVELVLDEKGRCATLNARGKNALQRALFATYFNAHMTTYLAMLNGYDPLPVPTMSWLKKVMDRYPRGGPEEIAARQNLERRPGLEY